MMGHKICFYREMWLIIPKLSLLTLLIWSTAFGKSFWYFTKCQHSSSTLILEMVLNGINNNLVLF